MTSIDIYQNTRRRSRKSAYGLLNGQQANNPTFPFSCTTVKYRKTSKKRLLVKVLLSTEKMSF
jgi:hypothetical protein